MVKRVLFSFIFVLVVAVGKSQTPDFNFKEIAPDANCKPVVEFSVIAPASTSTYAWDFGDGNTGTAATVTHTFDAAGTFNVSLTENGRATLTRVVIVEDKPCVAGDSLAESYATVQMLNQKRALGDTVSVPNVFTPDGDGINDLLKITSNGKDEMSVKIYSRAGALVYEEHAAVVLWDGKTVYGKDLASGIYYYVVTRVDKSPEQKGFFYLLRGK